MVGTNNLAIIALWILAIALAIFACAKIIIRIAKNTKETKGINRREYG